MRRALSQLRLARRGFPPVRLYRSVSSRALLLPDRDSPSSGGGVLHPNRDFYDTARHHHQQRRSFFCLFDGIGSAKHHEEKRVMGYSPEQVFDVASRVEFYPDFIPWCQKAVVRKNGKQMEADLHIGYSSFTEVYTSCIELQRPRLVKATVPSSSIFEYLKNVWEMKPGPVPGSCHLHFVVDFQFKSSLYNQVAGLFFDEVVAQMVGAFEKRCATVYGPSRVALQTTTLSPN